MTRRDPIGTFTVKIRANWKRRDDEIELSRRVAGAKALRGELVRINKVGDSTITKEVTVAIASDELDPARVRMSIVLASDLAVSENETLEVQRRTAAEKGLDRAAGPLGAALIVLVLAVIAVIAAFAVNPNADRADGRNQLRETLEPLARNLDASLSASDLRSARATAKELDAALTKRESTDSAAAILVKIAQLGLPVLAAVLVIVGRKRSRLGS